jgi:hypothetical protein
MNARLNVDMVYTPALIRLRRRSWSAHRGDMTYRDATAHRTTPVEKAVAGAQPRRASRPRPAARRRDDRTATHRLVVCYLVVGVLGLVAAVLLAMAGVSDAAVTAAALTTVASLRIGGQIWRQRHRPTIARLRPSASWRRE